MRRLLEEVKREHFPNPPASAEQVAQFESAQGWMLDEDLRAFYLACNGAKLFRKLGATYFFLPLERIIRARLSICGEDSEECGPGFLYAICDVQDNNYVAVDVRNSGGPYPLFDCFHETFPEPAYTRQIAPSFSSFLEQALRSKGHLFWLGGAG